MVPYTSVTELTDLARSSIKSSFEHDFVSKTPLPDHQVVYEHILYSTKPRVWSIILCGARWMILFTWVKWWSWALIDFDEILRGGYVTFHVANFRNILYRFVVKKSLGRGALQQLAVKVCHLALFFGNYQGSWVEIVTISDNIWSRFVRLEWNGIGTAGEGWKRLQCW